MPREKNSPNHLYSWSMNIVFVHFKTKLPKHLILNLRRTVMLFPDHQVVLITDQNVSNLNIPRLVSFHFYESHEWLEIEGLLDHPRGFRGNFWFTSLGRFIALAYFAKYHNGPLVHIESDVIISSDFPFDAISKVEANFAYPVVSETQAIASCLFIKDEQSAQFLATFALESVRLNHSTTDMYVLHDLLTQHPAKVQILPSTPPQREIVPAASQEFINKIAEGTQYFKGIFDGFDIGRYLFGDDPRNDRGFSVLRRQDPRSYVHARKLDFSITKEREFPYVKNGSSSESLPIFALHVHSKNLKFFKTKMIASEVTKSVVNSKKRTKKIFSVKSFLVCAVNAVRRRVKKVGVS